MNQKLLYVVGTLLIIFAFLIGNRFTAFDFGRSGTSIQNTSLGSAPVVLIAGSTEKFNFLSQQRSSSCGLQPVSVEGYSDDQRIQGSCCSPMDLHRYQEQVEGLKQYSHISQIPEDPYDISAALAKELFGYQKSITLTTEQQKIYDQAMELSHEGGPCCCKCWRWHAFEGQAKYLITQYNWNSQQIADLWDLQDGCGGAGQTHGEGHT